MNKVVFIFWIGLILVNTVACGTLAVGIERPLEPDPGLQQTIVAMKTTNAKLATQIAKPTSSSATVPATLTRTIKSTSTTTPTILRSTPTITETIGPPQFASLYFSTQPDGPAQRFFVAGIQRIYAIWEYKNMNVGMIVRRIWEKDGELWSERSETWDMPKYGAQGIKRDIFIYDFDYGLQPGRYSISLEIDGVTQVFGTGESAQKKVEFWVVPSDIAGPITSPNKAYTIFLFWGGRVSLRDLDGNFRDLVITNEISSMAWFPDSRHILYGDRDRTKQITLNNDTGITHQLWILDVITGERHMIGSTEENFHHPLLSPNGQYISILSGNTYMDACRASPISKIIELSDKLQRKTIYQIEQFSGLPSVGSDDSQIYPGNPNHTGSWEDSDTFVIYLRWSCTRNSAQTDGIYLLHLDTMQAERLMDQ